MIGDLSPMLRVSRQRPCPVCGRPDWCLVSENESAAICARISEGAAKTCGDAGYLHILRERPQEFSPRRTRTVRMRDESRRELVEMAADYCAAADPALVMALAEELGLSDRSLGRLRIGWSAEHGAWSFPMSDERQCVRGIRLRTPGGRKFAVSGGREGLFIPIGLTFLDRLLICEGPTDTAAALDLGFEAVGRPSCTGGTRLLRNLVSGKRPSEVVVVADGDGPGLRGAESLAATLVLCCPAVRIIQPPEGIKDLRAWLQAGATHDKVLAVIEAAPLRKLKLNREAR